jgi:hypothetical protein
MTRAAKNVASSAEETAKKFGHLHIVFRDWQAADSDPAAVLHHLFDAEGSSEGATRDQIRKDVLGSFSSVSVWLFDAPSESTAALKTELTIDRTSEAFRGQVRSLRKTLAEQLKEPTLFAGRPLTGKTVVPLIKLVADTLNSGETVMPHSAYVSMMKTEVEQFRRQLEVSMKAAMEQQLQAVNVNAEHHEGFLTEQAAVDGVRAVLDSLVEEFQNSCSSNVGDLSEDMREMVMSDTSSVVARMKEGVLEMFVSVYRGKYTQWLMGARRRAEAVYETAVKAVEAAKWPFLEDALEEKLEALLITALNSLGGNNSSSDTTNNESEELKDARKQLRTHCELRAVTVRAANKMRLESSRAEATAMVTYATNTMRQFVDDKVR